mgnify:FL=1
MNEPVHSNVLVSEEIETTGSQHTIVDELNDIEEAGLLSIKGYKISEISTVMDITPQRARRYINDYKNILDRRVQDDPYFLEKVQYNTLRAIEEFEQVSKEAWETVTIATDHGMISARVQALKLASDVASKKAQLHHLLGGNNADVEYVARMQRAESVNQILSKILRDTVSQFPEIAAQVRGELALAFEMMEIGEELEGTAPAKVVDVDSDTVDAEIVEDNDDEEEPEGL